MATLAGTGTILLVDDSEENRELLSRHLQRQGYTVQGAPDGMEALHLLETSTPDLILLDIMMPGLDGTKVLDRIKSNPATTSIPVIMISAVDDLESVVKCLELGAEDYIFKPFKPILLRARVNASFEKKRLRDKETAYLQVIKTEQEKAERLLLNILPKPIAERLKQSTDIIADTFAETTVLFADIVDFTTLSARTPPAMLVALLNRLFSLFDDLAEHYEIEKIKTVGDSYMLASGLPTPRPDHIDVMARMALDMLSAVKGFKADDGTPIAIRIGMHSGPVTAGVIGSRKFAYDLWGDTVNTASRMESSGLPGHIQVSEAVYTPLAARFNFEKRGMVTVKGKGEMATYFLVGPK